MIGVAEALYSQFLTSVCVPLHHRNIDRIVNATTEVSDANSVAKWSPLFHSDGCMVGSAPQSPAKVAAFSSVTPKKLVHR